MDKLLMHMLGYLTPNQWIDACKQSSGSNVNWSKEAVRSLAMKVSVFYGGIFSDEEIKKLNK